MKKKILVIGLDSATFDLIKPWVEEGILPNLSKLIKSGVSGNLTSTNPVISAAAWNSFFTGKNPGKHGVFGFRMRRPNSYEAVPITTNNRDSAAIWNILGDDGMKVGIVNTPVTYPPEKVNGFMLSGILTPKDSNFTYPESLLKEINEKIGGYRIYMKETYALGNEDTYLKDLYHITEKREEAMIYLMNTYDWDFFFGVFYYLDQIQHFFWKYMDSTHPQHDSDESKKYKNAILEYYQKIDQAIAVILKNIDKNTTVIIASDHGAGPLHKKVYWNNWLMDIGLLKLKKRSGFTASYIRFWLNKFGLKATNIGKFLVDIGLYKYIKGKVPKKIQRIVPSSYPSYSDIDWSKTKVWMDTNDGININLKGREPEGIVEQGKEYEELREYIIKEACKVRDPKTGEKIVHKISKREEILWGNNIDKAPDLIITNCDRRYWNAEDFGDDIFSNDLCSSYHRKNGILIMRGPNIKKGVEIENAEIIDIASTILYIMGVPIPEDMDGKVLTDIFDLSFLEENSIQYKNVKTGKIYSKSCLEEKSVIGKRLKKLCSS